MRRPVSHRHRVSHAAPTPALPSNRGGRKFPLGALVSLLVTVADIGILNIGAAFCGPVAGFIVSWLMEKADFVALANKD